MVPDEFLAAWARLNEDCPQVQGAVLATREGLLLAASGCLQDEASAASAADLAERVDQNLSLMASTQCSELLIWASPSIWYLTRLSLPCVLMVCAAPSCRTGALRLAGQNVARQLSQLLDQAEHSAHEEKSLLPPDRESAGGVFREKEPGPLPAQTTPCASIASATLTKPATLAPST